MVVQNDIFIVRMVSEYLHNLLLLQYYTQVFTLCNMLVFVTLIFHANMITYANNHTEHVSIDRFTNRPLAYGQLVSGTYQS